MEFLAGDFIYRDQFSFLSDDQITAACQEILARFGGVLENWKVLPPNRRHATRKLCMSYLVAWHLVNKYPSASVGASGMGGLPLKSKSIADIHLTYNLPMRDTSLLASLTTNAYGLAALEMIQTAPENYQWLT